MSDLITQYTRKPAHYQHLDGTAELTLGIALVTWTICFRISQGILLFMAVNAALWPIFHFGTRYVRRRLVYPRSGYIKPQKHHGMFALALLICLAAVVGLSFLYAKHRAVLSDSFVFSLIMGVTLLVRASIDRLRRLGVLAMVSVAIGLALQFLGLRQAPGTSWYFLLMGTAFLISGAPTLRSYVRSMPPRDLEAE